MNASYRNTTRILRISIVLIVLAAGFATHAFAATDSTQSPQSPTIKLYKSLSTYRYMDNPETAANDYGPVFTKSEVTPATGDILEQTAYGKNYGRKFVNYEGTSNAPVITKTTGDRDYKISFKSTIVNTGTYDLNGYMWFESFAPAGVTINSVNITPLNNLSAQHFVKIFKPGEYGTVSANQKSDWIAHVTNTANGSITMPGTIAPHFLPGNELDFRFEINLNIASTALAADLSCEGSQTQSEDYFYDNLPGRKGIVLRTSLGQSVESEFGKFDMGALPRTDSGPVEISRADARYCADFSSVVAPVTATTQAQVATTQPVQSTVVTTPIADPKADPLVRGGGTQAMQSNGLNPASVAPPAQVPTNEQLPVDVPVEQPLTAETPTQKDVNVIGDKTVSSILPTVTTDVLEELTKKTGTYSPNAASPSKGYTKFDTVSEDVLDSVIAKNEVQSQGPSSSRNVEYAIAGMLVLCAISALAANKKFARPSAEYVSQPRVIISPSDSVAAQSVMTDPRMYNTDIKFIDLESMTYERERVEVSAASISSGAKIAQPRVHAYDATLNDRQSLSTRIWDELVKRCTRETVRM